MCQITKQIASATSADEVESIVELAADQMGIHLKENMTYVELSDLIYGKSSMPGIDDDEACDLEEMGDILVAAHIRKLAIQRAFENWSKKEEILQEKIRGE